MTEPKLNKDARINFRTDANLKQALKLYAVLNNKTTTQIIEQGIIKEINYKPERND